MYPYHGTKGLTYADRELAVSYRLDPAGREVIVGVCPSGKWQGKIELSSEGRPLGAWTIQLDPETLFLETIDVSQLSDEAIAGLRLRVGSERTGWRTHVITNSR